MKIICKSKKTKDLSKTEINNICKLKNKHWNFGLKSQLIWFKKNSSLKKDGISNLNMHNEPINLK